MSYKPTNEKYLQITVGGVDYSEHFTFPFVIQSTGTEQLDTAIITLSFLKTDAKFAPFTPVSLGGGKYSYFVANDAVKEVFGRKRWHHELTLIDSTKQTERVLMESKAFTQPLVSDFAEAPKNAKCYKYSALNDNGNNTISATDYELIEIKDNTYKTPVKRPNDFFHLYSVNDFSDNVSVADSYKVTVSLYYHINTVITPDVSSNYNPVFSEQVPDINTSLDLDVNLFKNSGIYSIIYDVVFSYVNATVIRKVYTVPVSIVDTADLRKPYTLYDVLQILLETAEPLRYGLDTPRYRLKLTDDQMERFQSTTAPELHFSNGRSLYENLSLIGKYVHCIPRVNNDGEVTFKELGSSEYADMSKGSLFGASEQYNASDYASTLEANFANLINTEDESEGSVTDPYTDGYITLRADDARIKEGNAFIPTKFPIAKIKSLLVRVHDSDGAVSHTADITKYLFEKNEYDLLSGFSGIFPYSKTYALCYSTGGKRIDGLWYKAEDEALSILNSFQKYAIANIIEDSTGLIIENKDIGLLLRLSFQITYIPIIDGRARQERTEYTGNGKIVLAHNQSANKMSARAFGENLRGQIAMMGNATKTRMYLYKDLKDVPTAGLLFDENHYISSVTTRVFPGHCVCQVDLSANYNDLGAYAELKTDIRQYEIPQGEDRFTLLEEYCVIGKKEINDLNTLCTDTLKENVMRSFDALIKTEDISAVKVTTYDENMKAIFDPIALSVYSTSIGNSVYLGFSFDDNYAAGARSVGTAATAYRGMDYVPYGDKFYSTAKYLNFDFVSKFTDKAAYTPLGVANDLPRAVRIEKAVSYVRTGAAPLIWNKDSADSGNVAYQLHFVTNDGYVIGSELARMMRFVRTSSTDKEECAMIYFYDHRINQLTGDSGTTINEGLVASSELSIKYDHLMQSYSLTVQDIPNVPFRSWVIKRPDNQCIIGKNSDTVDKTIYFNFKRKR